MNIHFHEILFFTKIVFLRRAGFGKSTIAQRPKTSSLETKGAQV